VGRQYGTCYWHVKRVRTPGLDSAMSRDVRCRCIERSVMRNLVLAMLLVTMPLSGMRVICVDSAAPTETGSDCERLCARHHVSSSTNSSTCALSTDASSLIVFASTAALGPEEPVQAPLVVSAVSADSPRCCLDPELAHHVPPPKPQAL